MASPAVEALFGWLPTELVGQSVEVLIPEETRSAHQRHRDAYAANPVARPMGSGLDLWGKRRDGSCFPVDVSLAPVLLDGRALVGAFVRDATERRRREDLLRYVNQISRQVLAGDPTPEILSLTARRARDLASGRASWVVLPAGSDRFVVAAADGEGTRVLVGAELSSDDTLSKRAMVESKPLVVEHMALHPHVLAASRSLGLGPGLYLPMSAQEGPIGTLVVARSVGQDAFSAVERAALEVFASAAAVVLSLGRARQELERLCVVSEHERIARDLHDTVIQRLFALGMSLQGLRHLVDGLVEERIGSAVEAIDEVIREIRETIFGLSAAPTDGPDIRGQLRRVAAEAVANLGFEPRLNFRGPVEVALDEDLLTDLLAVAREALSNVARHAKACSVELVLRVDGPRLILSIADDGVGIPDGPSAGHGLANLAARAEKRGGELYVARRHPAGTLVEWRVPL